MYLSLFRAVYAFSAKMDPGRRPDLFRSALHVSILQFFNLASLFCAIKLLGADVVASEFYSVAAIALLVAINLAYAHTHRHLIESNSVLSRIAIKRAGLYAIATMTAFIAMLVLLFKAGPGAV
jgi:hypothetical protein